MIHFNNNKRTPTTRFPLYGTQWTTSPRYNNTPSKIVSIPVHFVGSERNRSDSAVKIQRFARGFLVRKSLKKMLKMKVELEEIEKKMKNEEIVKKMKKEQKEKVMMGEIIMNLLLRLDSVRVFHCSYSLRDLRKFFIKRAIVLQEFIDQIQMMTSEDKCDGVEENRLEMEKVGCEEENEGGKNIEALVNCVKKEEGGYKEEHEEDSEGKCVKEESQDEEGKKMEALWKEEEMEESVGTSFVEEGIEEDSAMKQEEDKILIGCEEVEENCYKEGDDEKRKMLKRMMEDNEKMMEMMAQLFERNEKQTKLLTSLTQRVEQLERAYTCDKLKKKKNKRRNIDAKHRY